MDTANFHDQELEQFMESTTANNVTKNDLLVIFREDITMENIMTSTNRTRYKLRDYLDTNGVQCGKGTGDPVQKRLLALIDPTPTGSSGDPASQAPSVLANNPTLRNSAKRDF